MSPALTTVVMEVSRDSDAAHLALVGRDGRIIAVNAAWQAFADDNGAVPGTTDVGTDYLSACTGVPGPDGEDGQRVALALRAAFAGARERVVAVYPCHSPTDRRWFEVRVRGVAGGDAAVVAHVPVDESALLTLLAATLTQLGGVLPGADDVDDLATALAADGATVRAALPRLGQLRDTLARPVAPAPVTPTGLLESALATRPELREVVDLRADDTVLEADDRVIAGLLLELVRNVADHGGGDGLVTISEPSAGGVRILVEDRGPGIAEERRERVMVPLLGDAEGQGLGIGLPIARALAHHHGGWLLVEGRDGGGCRVRVEL